MSAIFEVNQNDLSVSATCGHERLVAGQVKRHDRSGEPFDFFERKKTVSVPAQNGVIKGCRKKSFRLG